MVDKLTFCRLNRVTGAMPIDPTRAPRSDSILAETSWNKSQATKPETQLSNLSTNVIDLCIVGEKHMAEQRLQRRAPLVDQQTRIKGNSASGVAV